MRELIRITCEKSLVIFHVQCHCVWMNGGPERSGAEWRVFLQDMGKRAVKDQSRAQSPRKSEEFRV